MENYYSILIRVGDSGVSHMAGESIDQDKIPENNFAFCNTYSEPWKWIFHLDNLMLGICLKHNTKNTVMGIYQRETGQLKKLPMAKAGVMWAK